LDKNDENLWYSGLKLLTDYSIPLSFAYLSKDEGFAEAGQAMRTGSFFVLLN
jgi:hypothetical protein